MKGYWKSCKYLGKFVEAVADTAGYGRHDEPVPPVTPRRSAHCQWESRTGLQISPAHSGGA